MTYRQLLAVSAGGIALALAACAGPTTEPVSIAMGANPVIEKPQSSLLPTLKIAEAVGWGAGQMPVAAEGLQVTAFATGLDHPRWLNV